MKISRNGSTTESKSGIWKLQSRETKLLIWTLLLLMSSWAQLLFPQLMGDLITCLRLAQKGEGVRPRSKLISRQARPAPLQQWRLSTSSTRGSLTKRLRVKSRLKKQLSTGPRCWRSKNLKKTSSWPRLKLTSARSRAMTFRDWSSRASWCTMLLARWCHSIRMSPSGEPTRSDSHLLLGR